MCNVFPPAANILIARAFSHKMKTNFWTYYYISQDYWSSEFLLNLAVSIIPMMTIFFQADRAYSENCFTCLTNQGDLAIHSLPDLRRQVIQPACIKKEDVVGIASLVFTPDGQAFFQVIF